MESGIARIKVLIDINELKRLRQIEKEYLSKSNESSALNHTGYGVTGPIPGPDPDPEPEPEPDPGHPVIIGITPSLVNPIEDQRALTIPKEVTVSESPQVQDVGKDSTKTLNNDIVTKAVRKRYRHRASKLLTELQKFPEDFTFDNNGLISIEKQLIPGNTV